ncbi:ribonuclease domain-containing protein [Stenotrophomonas bentonitica]|uniref:RHS repeat-associated core domain-containing protein n=1 Tax=Stenotrophomonas bentonitica TaxID=1450134 RepID=UPI00345E0C44
MASLTGALNAPAIYRYDAENLLVCTGTSSTSLWRYWLGEVVVNAANDDNELSWTYHGGRQVATLRVGGKPSSTLLGTDRAGSVLVEADTEVRSQRYTPYGYLPSDGAEPRQAYNGELLDNPSGCYLLGAGHHRPYSPALHAFLAPDAFSPFDEGGLNAYAYCAGDPINRNDPSGHFWQWIFAGIGVVAAVVSAGMLVAPIIAGSAALTASVAVGAGFSAAGAGLEIGALIAHATGNTTAATVLGAIGIGVSAIGVLTSLPSIAHAAAKGIGKLGKAAASRTGLRSSATLGAKGSLNAGAGSRAALLPSPVSAPKVLSQATHHSPSRVTQTLLGKPGKNRPKVKWSTPTSVAPAGPSTPPVDYTKLTAEAQTILTKIKSGAPMKYPQHDGVPFLNYEKYLPRAQPGDYLEYTVPTPGVFGRGEQRLVLGDYVPGGPAGPRTVYHTTDHYKTFFEVKFPTTMDPWYPR